MRFLKIIFFIIVLFVLAFITLLFINFRAPQKNGERERFVVQQKTVSEKDIIDDLKKQGYLKSEMIFNLIFDLKGWHGRITPGGYLISKNMNAYQLAQTLSLGPSQKWVLVPPGKRKEQTALILQKTLDWSDDKTLEFVKLAEEGYLFPDTYLISKDIGSEVVVQMFKTNFDRYFDDKIQKDLLSENIKYTTALKIASIIERESGGDEDKPIIAGIIWNRLLKGMRLEIDATVQYAWANNLCELSSQNPLLKNCNFWPIIPSGTVRTIESPFNTYLDEGLPPSPIDSPSLASIKAAVYPQETEDLYYLHSADKKIHTAKTYKEHRENINMYLIGNN